MSKILFPTSSTPGPADRPRAGQGRLINAYCDKVGERLNWRRVPGMLEFVDLGASGVRGMIYVGGLLYVAVGSTIKTVSSSGVVTTLTGTLTGTGPVTFARNNKLPTPDLVVVADGTAYTVSTAAIGAYPDADVGAPETVATLDGYFEFSYGDGKTRASDLNTTTINSLSVATAETRPDGLVRVGVQGQQVVKFGLHTTEFWQNVGSSPYPFARVTARAFGLAGEYACAGFDEGWTGPILFVSSDNTVRKLSGYEAEKVSTEVVERDIAALTTAERAALESWVYIFDGQQIFTLSSGTWTWEYNVTTGAWHERRSYGETRWRGHWAVRAFDKWIVGDRSSTWLYELRTDYFREDLDPLIWEVESALNRDEVIAVADFRFVTGVGLDSGITPIETDPQVGMSYSDDGGGSWSAPLMRSLGQEGDRLEPVRYRRLGRLRNPSIGRRYRLTVSDPVYVDFEGGDASR